jgi:hypothetical protein
MGAICSFLYSCKQSANNGENSQTRCGVLVFAGILSKEQDPAMVYLRGALCLE